MKVITWSEFVEYPDPVSTEHTCFCLWLCDRDLDEPFFPDDFLVVNPPYARQPAALPPLFVTKLHRYLSSHTSVRRVERGQLMYQRRSSGFDQSLELRRICDIWQGDVEVG